MFAKIRFLSAILLTIFLAIPCLFSGEIYRWTDERGTVHFTDDASKIPRRYSDRAERIEVRDKILKEIEEIDNPQERPDRVKDYLENIEKKIAAKKDMERKIAELEEEVRLSEDYLKRIEEYERENYLYYQPFKDRRTGKWVPVASPLYEEKRRLKARIEALKVEIKGIQESVSRLMRSL